MIPLADLLPSGVWSCPQCSWHIPCSPLLLLLVVLLKLLKTKDLEVKVVRVSPSPLPSSCHDTRDRRTGFPRHPHWEGLRGAQLGQGKGLSYPPSPPVPILVLISPSFQRHLHHEALWVSARRGLRSLKCT